MYSDICFHNIGYYHNISDQHSISYYIYNSCFSNNQPSKTSNTGLIAGAVVGPVVAFALGALALWFFYIRKRRSKAGETNTGGATTPHQPYYSEISGSQSPDIKTQLPVYNQTGTYEMSARDYRTHELPADSNR
jgi:hypothetical protein